MKRLFVFLSLLLVLSLMNAETIWIENFDDPAIDGKGAIGPDNTINMDGVTKWNIDISSASLTATSDWFMVDNTQYSARDIDGNAIWFTEAIDISTFTDVAISIDASSLGDFEDDDFIKGSYQLDGGDIIDFGIQQGPYGEDDNSTWSGEFSVTGLTGSSLLIYVTTLNGASAEYFFFDNVTVTGTSGSVDPEPSNHPANFTATANGWDTIALSWDNNDGTVPADGYLIKCNTTGLGVITNPTDGVEVADDTDMSDGEGAVNVMHGRNGYNWTGLADDTTYYYAIYAYTNGGTNIDYNTTYGFSNPRPTAEATTDPEPDTIEFEDFESQTLGNWSTYDVSGDQSWGASSYGGAWFAKMTGYSSGTHANEDWFISPALDFTSYTDERMSFVSAAYQDNTDNSLTVYVSTDYIGSGDPNSANWTDITSQCALSTGGYGWVESGTIDLSSYENSSVYIAFKYVSTDTSANTWEIDNINIMGFFQGGNLPPQISNVNIDPVAPGTSDAVTVRADVIDESRSVSTVKCWWDTSSGALNNEIAMTLETGNTWVTSSAIPAQTGGTTVYYKIEAIDDQTDNSFSAEYSYTVAAGITIHMIQGEAAASPYLGQIVTTSGIVTGLAYNGYYLQDGAGAWNGIWVYDPSNSPAQGDMVTVTATVAEYYDLTELSGVTAFNIDSNGNTLPEPTVITTVGLTEEFEGVLVRVVGATCTEADTGDGEWSVDDGSGAMIIHDQMLSGYTPTAGYTYDVTGIGDYNYGAYKLEPRYEADVTEHSVEDTTPPTIDDVSVVNETTVVVDFNEDVEETTAEDVLNYWIHSRVVTITEAVRDDIDNSIVTLTVSGMVYGNYTIEISDVEDLSENGTDGATFNFTYTAPEMIELVINEINYNPPEAGTDTLEFIEIYNAGDNEIDLEGFYFGLGVTYTFQAGDAVAAGDYFVVCVNATAFENFYGFAPDAQWSSGGLSNGGETITLIADDAAVLDEVTYDDAGDWPTLPDGNGPSLELIDPSLDNEYGVNWSPSNADYGTPGAQNSVYNIDTVVRFNPGTGEYNEDAGTFDLVLSITRPSETVSTTVDVVLIDGDAADINNYTTQSVTFPVNDNTDQTVTITITDDFDIEAPDTLYFELQNIAGGNNAGVGTPDQFELIIIDNDVPLPELVINEIYYNAPGDDDPYEFFEIYNAGTESVDLEGVYVSEGIDYTFPAESSIAVGEYIVVAFTAATYEGNGYQVFQWTGGALSNGGEDIELRAANGAVIDYVDYGETDPWPSACDGDGPSLELNGTALDNSLAANWSASLVDYGTPGAENSVVGGQIEAPVNVVIVINGNDVSIDWDDVNGAAQYHIYRGTSLDNMTLFDSVTSSEYLDVGASAEPMYFYKVTADTEVPVSRRR